MPADPQAIRAGAILRAAALFLAGMVLTAAILHAAIVAGIHDPVNLHADSRSEKLAEMRSWHAKAFSAAFGSSHVMNGFDPRVVDRVLAGTPLATHSVNLAIEGGAQSEQLAMANAFVGQLESPAQAGAAAEPCFITLELSAGTNFTVDHLVHPRSINIYDLPTTRIMSDMVTPDMPLSRRAGRIGFAWAAMVEHYINLGMLSNVVFKPSLNQKTIDEETWNDQRGMLANPASNSNDISANLRFKKLWPANWPATSTVHQEPILPGNAALIDDIQAHSRVPHLTFVYIVMPSLNDPKDTNVYPDHLRAAGQDVPIINLALPGTYPDLYDLRLWHDPAHLAQSGATVLSTHYAQALARWYATHGAPQACG